MYEKIMNSLDKYVERVEGTVVHYNNQKALGTISKYDEDGIFFRHLIMFMMKKFNVVIKLNILQLKLLTTKKVLLPAKLF